MPCTAENPAAVAAADNAPRPRKETILPQICAQALAGQSCRQLAATFGLTKSTVSRWLQELREDCPTRVAGAAEIIAHAVARYDALYRKALDAWHLSQADKLTESVVETETARGPKKKRTRRTESQAGKPVFLAEARRALDGIARIVARIAPRPGKVGVPIADGTAERDEYVGVPSRPSAIKARSASKGVQDPTSLTRKRVPCRASMALAPDITAERDEYVGVPSRPSAGEAPDPKLSHAELKPAAQARPISDATAERDEYVAVPSRPGTVEAPAPKLSHPQHKPLSAAGFSAWRTRPMVDMNSLLRGVTRPQNSAIGWKCPTAHAATAVGGLPGAGRSRRRGKQPGRAACAPLGRE